MFSILKSRNDDVSVTYQNDGSIHPADDVKIHGATYGEDILDDIVSQQYTINKGLSSGVKGGLISESFTASSKKSAKLLFILSTIHLKRRCSGS